MHSSDATVQAGTAMDKPDTFFIMDTLLLVNLLHELP